MIQNNEIKGYKRSSEGRVNGRNRVFVTVFLALFIAISIIPNTSAVMKLKQNPDEYGCYNMDNNTLCNETFFDNDFDTYYNGTDEEGFALMRYNFDNLDYVVRENTVYTIKLSNQTLNFSIPLDCWGCYDDYPNSILLAFYDYGILGTGIPELACAIQCGPAGVETSLSIFNESEMYEEELYYDERNLTNVPNITDCFDLYSISLNLSGDYQIMNDIDCSEFRHFTMGKALTEYFNGTLDGNGYTISGLEVIGTSNIFGLFYGLSGCYIHDIVFTDNTLAPDSGTLTTSGILFGTAALTYGVCVLDNLYFINNTINTTYRNFGLIGGITDAAINFTNSVVRNENGYFIQTRYGTGRIGGAFYNFGSGSYADNITIDTPIYVTTELVSNPTMVGGFAGFLIGNINRVIIECSQSELICEIGSTPDGSQPSGTLSNSGGISGNCVGTITNSYSTVNVTGNDNVGSLCGLLSAFTVIEDSYGIGRVNCVSSCGGGCGGTVTTLSDDGVFYDNQTTGYTSSQCGTGHSTAEMQEYDLYLGLFDFINIWDLNPGITYPYFGTDIFVPDFTAPVLTINSPLPTTYNVSDILVNITSDDVMNPNEWLYNFNGTNVSFTNPESVEFSEGLVTLYIWGMNIANLTGTNDITFAIVLPGEEPPEENITNVTFPLTGSFLMCDGNVLIGKFIDNVTINGETNETITWSSQYCQFGCSNDNLLALGNPACNSSNTIQLGFMIIILVVCGLFLRWYFNE